MNAFSSSTVEAEAGKFKSAKLSKATQTLLQKETKHHHNYYYLSPKIIAGHTGKKYP